MMQNGAFRRFLQSKEFQAYYNTTADFSMPTTETAMFSSLSIVPVADEEHTASKIASARNGQPFDVADYIRSL